MSAWEDVFEGEGSERVHSRFAPSSLKRILECPRSVALAEAIGSTGKASVYAAEGSVAHTVAEAYLRGTPAPAVGTVVEQDGYKITVDQDMHDHGREYATYVRGLMVEGDVCFIETTVRLDSVVGEAANMYGHLDAAIWSPSRGLLIVVDYKYGRGVRVSALDNAQLKAYGLGAIYTLPAVDPDDVKTIEAHVFQPRVPGMSAPDTIPAVDLLMWGHEEVAPTIAEIEQDGAVKRPYVTGDHCRFCPALAQCPAMRDRAIKAAQKAFADDPVPESALSDDEMADLLNEIDVCEPWFDAVRKESLIRAERGGNIRDRKLVAARGRRAWSDEQNVPVALVSLGLSKSDIYETSLRSPAQIEKKVAKANREAFNALWTMRSSGHSLVPTSDPRPGVRVATAAEAFRDAPLQD